MKILAIIPARGGSKGVSKKNSKLLNGVPLIEYTIQSALQSKLIAEMIVNSDDDEILSIAQKNNIRTYKRSNDLASDTSNSIDVVHDNLKQLLENGEKFDGIILLQPTSPFRPKGFIDMAIEKFIKFNFDSLLSVLEVPHEFNPHWTFEASGNQLHIATGEKEIIKRRQDLPKAYHRDGSIYLTKTKVILNQKSFYGNSIGYIQSNPDYYCNIDTPKDWEIAENKCKTLNL